MTRSKAPFYIFVVVMIVAGLVLSWHRHAALGVPLLPGTLQHVWLIEARIAFAGQGEPALVSLALPDTQDGFDLLNEFTASPGYGLAFTNKGAARRAEWSIREAKGPQVIYYRAEFAEKEQRSVLLQAPSLPPRASPLLSGSGPHITLARAMIESARYRSANALTLARELIREFHSQPDTNMLLQQHGSREDWLVALLNEAGVSARSIDALVLEDGRRRSGLQRYLQVFSEQGDYVLYDPAGAEGISFSPLLMWEYHDQSVFDVIGGGNSALTFSMIRQKRPINTAVNPQSMSEPELLDFSINSLPISEQALFKGILLIPIGVLVVCLFRIVVGIRTAGTFMPVLIAIAFIQTSLVTGLVGFILIVGIGLMIRGYLSRLNLLLVARISSVIISVIILIALFAVISYQLGLSEGLKISFFPMVILSWTIERTSILWEEEGSQEVFVQVGGSLFIALITYALMLNETVQHLTFNFLGLQLVIMAMVLLLGTYSGYRLLELHRFFAMITYDKRKVIDDD